MIYNLDKNIVDAINRVGKKHNINKITLFGSRARGDNKLHSDIDLAIDVDKNLDNRSLIYFDLEDIETLLKLDIVFIDKYTDQRLMLNIERDGVILYEREQ
ncbi:MAG: nucleotidyltransferase domain-containing protein [Clostridium sp.]